jgi:hypothetical protein
MDRLPHWVRDGVSKFKGLDIGDELGIWVLAQWLGVGGLRERSLTVPGGLRFSDEGYHSSYRKVRRVVGRKLGRME